MLLMICAIVTAVLACVTVVFACLAWKEVLAMEKERHRRG